MVWDALGSPPGAAIEASRRGRDGTGMTGSGAGNDGPLFYFGIELPLSGLPTDNTLDIRLTTATARHGSSLDWE